MNAVEIRDLCKSYDGFSIDHLNLTLPSGCIMGLIGENGAGKSTTIKLILDMIKRDSGTISVLGKDNRENFHLTKEDIGVVLDEVGFSENINAVQIGKIMKLSFRNWDSGLYEQYLEKLDIPRKKVFRKLSKGMKMKLGIAAALSHAPKLLILDEATSGLDPVVRDEFMDMISEFTRNEGHSVLMSSHIVSDLEKICDYIAFLHKGKLLLCEEKDILFERYGIIRCSAQELSELDENALIGKKESAYGVEAIADREKLPAGMNISPIDIEKLFIFMVKDK